MKTWYKIKSFLLTLLGDIKVFPWPMFIVYHPETFDVKGTHTRKVMNLLKPGDIIQRKYKRYLDGQFIPGEYSHSGIYVGDNTVIHAIAEGVVECDIIDYLRCDGYRVLRQDNTKLAKKAVKRCYKYLGKPYDFNFESNEQAIYCHELAAIAYKDVDVPKIIPQLLFIKGKEKVYLADSFLENFEIVDEYKGKKK